MATTRRFMRGVSPSQVFRVLADGRSYAHWVVGTRAIRDVDPGWPAAGTRLHYTVGYRPLRHDDVTTSLGCTEPTRLDLEAQAWPAGTASIVLRVEAQVDGSWVSIDEEPSRGLAKRLHNPALDLLIKVRNVESLRRLERQARLR